jgi:hypothetical protein
MDYEMRATEFITEHKKNRKAVKYSKKPKAPVDPHAEFEKQKAAVNTPTMESGKATRKLCTSTKPDSELGASQLSSCISQGLRARDTEKKFTINRKRQKVKGKKVKGGNYGGPLPVWKGNAE